MSLRTHLVHYGPHYSLGMAILGYSGVLEKLWEKTAWLRTMLGWVEKSIRFYVIAVTTQNEIIKELVLIS